MYPHAGIDSCSRKGLLLPPICRESIRNDRAITLRPRAQVSTPESNSADDRHLLAGRYLPDVISAEALFASHLQPSHQPTPHEVHEAIVGTLVTNGIDGCVAVMAQEFGEHPHTASARMAWALATVQAGRTAIPTELPHEDGRAA